MAKPPVHILADDDFVPAPKDRMGQHRDTTCVEDCLDGIFRPDVGAAGVILVQIVPDRDLLRSRIPISDHQVSHVGLSGIIQCEQRLDILLAEGKAEAIPEKIQPFLKLAHAKGMPLFHQLPDSVRTRVVAVAQDMVLPLLVLAGKLRSGEKCRIAAYSSFSRSSRAAFTTTNTEPQLCHSAPVTGLRMPSADNTTAARLMIRDAMMLTCTFFITFCMSLNR